MVAPILLLGFNRPQHLREAILSLSANSLALHSDIYVAIDGPRNERDIEKIQECRKIAIQAQGFRNVETIFQSENLGLSKSVISNTSRILSRYQSIIVVEDDLILSSNFLDYMNRGLDKYRDNLTVASIHGYQYPVKIPKSECQFLRGADCWGWATWSDRWNLFNSNSKELLDRLNAAGIANEFDSSITGNNLNLLRNQAEGKVDSWAIRWHASMYLQNKYTLFPPESLVLNNGLDGSGTHEGKSSIFDTKLSEETYWNFPEVVKGSQKLQRNITRYFRIKKFKFFFYRIIRYSYKILTKLDTQSKQQI